MTAARPDADLAQARVLLRDLPMPTALLHGRSLVIADANADLLRLLGTQSVENLRGRSLYELLGQGDAQHVRAALPSLVGGAQHLDVSFGFAPPRLGRGRLSLSAAGESPDRSRVVLASLTDLTVELDRLDAATRELLAMDSASRRLGHDLRQPLTVLAGYTRILQEGDLAPEERQRLLRRVAEAARRAAEQVDGLTGGHADAVGAEETVRLSDVAAWLEGLTALAFDDRGALLVNDIADAEVPVDDGVLRQVLLNLVNNALEHGGDEPHLRVHVTSRQVANGLEVLVTDTGQGIPDDALEDVFEHGVQLGVRPRRGRGTGLATSRRIVEEIGGWIAAVPHDGGARFVVWLPVDGGGSGHQAEG